MGGRIGERMTPEAIATYIISEYFHQHGEMRIVILEKIKGPIWAALCQIIDQCEQWKLSYTSSRVYSSMDRDEWRILRIKPDDDSRSFEGFLVWPSWLTFVLIEQPTRENLEIITGYLWHSSRVKIIKFGEEHATD